MTISIAMMIRLLSSMKVIKNERLRKLRLRKNSCLLLGILTDIGIGVFLKMKKKKRNRKIVEVVTYSSF